MNRYAASRFPSSVGACVWQAMLPPRIAEPALEQNTTADVVVIGAGFAGLSAARRLHQLDPRLVLVVLEAGIVGDGPAGCNSGFIIDLPHEVSSEDYGGDSLQKSRHHIALQRRAVSFATELAVEAAWGAETLDACGRYNLAVTPEGDAHLGDYACQLERLDEPHTRLEAKAAAELTGSRAYRSGLFMPGAAMVQPAAYIRGLADSLRAPVRLHQQTPAIVFERGSGGDHLTWNERRAWSSSALILRGWLRERAATERTAEPLKPGFPRAGTACICDRHRV